MASVDVAIPCYQYGRFLRGCVASVLSQEIQNLRVLIIDNASTDNSLEVARELAAEDSRIEVVAHRTNLGLHASLNEGIDWASSDYFKVLCADDFLTPGCLARAVSIMEQHPHVNLTYGRELAITSSDSAPRVDQSQRGEQWRVAPGKHFLERLCLTARTDSRHIMVVGTTVVVRTSAQKRVGYYRKELPDTSDNEMWMRFACHGAVAETDAIQGVRRHHPLSRSSSITSVQWFLQLEATLESFFAKEGASVPQARHLHRTALRHLGEEAYWSAMANLLRGDPRLSLDLLKFASTRCPSTVVLPPLGHLLRRRDAFGRFARLVRDPVRRLGTPSKPAQGRAP
jgi:glycosyltransferase involved in cell wall biosynthesis